MIICQALNAGLLLPTARALTFLSSPFAERSRLRIDKWFVGTTVYGIATKNPRWLSKWRDREWLTASSFSERMQLHHCSFSFMIFIARLIQEVVPFVFTFLEKVAQVGTNLGGRGGRSLKTLSNWKFQMGLNRHRRHQDGSSYQNILWNGADSEDTWIHCGFGSYMWDATGKLSMYWNVIRRNASAMCSVCSAILILI